MMNSKLIHFPQLVVLKKQIFIFQPKSFTIIFIIRTIIIPYSNGIKVMVNHLSLTLVKIRVLTSSIIGL